MDRSRTQTVRFHQERYVESSARRVPRPPTSERIEAHGQTLGEVVKDRSHRQAPLVSLVAISGDAIPVEDLEREFRTALLEVAEEFGPALRAARSCWTPFLGVIEQECSDAAPDEARLVRVV